MKNSGSIAVKPWRFAVAVWASIFFICRASNAQDLNCRVDIMSPQIQAPEKARVFKTLQRAITTFMNSRKWSADVLASQERIECNLILNITNWDGSSTYSATATVQSNRPVFGASYNTTILNLNDRQWNFTYTEGEPLEYSDNATNKELSNLLAYYSYTILGMDYDTFSNQGGTPYFLKAQNIVNQSQGSSSKGWRAFDDLRNRYWLSDNLLSPELGPFREAIYIFHRRGLDQMSRIPEKGRAEILGIFPNIMEAQNAKPNSMLSQLFFLAKSDEFIKIFQQAADTQEKTAAATSLSEADPTNASRYQQIIQ